MVAAYKLIEIYCELIVARLPIIESQKTCPIDLKEAVTRVIFAAPRCSDISELSDIKKQFTAKYGKEFVTAAIELQPNCGVSRMLVEKLSAVAPNLQTKIKVLSDVAKEHNIDWDSTSFEEKGSKPPNDLLNGLSNIVMASIPNNDPPKIQPSNISVVHSHYEKPNAHVNFAEQNRKYTLGTQNTTSTDNFNQDTSSSGINSGGWKGGSQILGVTMIFHQIGKTRTWNSRMLLLLHKQQPSLQNGQLWLHEQRPGFLTKKRLPSKIKLVLVFLKIHMKAPLMTENQRY